MIRLFSSSNFSALLICAPELLRSEYEGWEKPLVVEDMVLGLRWSGIGRIAGPTGAPLEGPRERWVVLLTFMTCNESFVQAHEDVAIFRTC